MLNLSQSKEISNYKDDKFTSNINNITREHINKIKNHDLNSNSWDKKYFESQLLKVSCPLREINLIR